MANRVAPISVFVTLGHTSAESHYLLVLVLGPDIFLPQLITDIMSILVMERVAVT